MTKAEGFQGLESGKTPGLVAYLVKQGSRRRSRPSSKTDSKAKRLLHGLLAA